MATLSNKIKTFLGTEVDFLNDVKLQNDGNGDYIKEWNLNTPQPTEAELNAIEDDANKLERNNVIIAKRKSLYGSWDKQLEEINEQGLDAWKARIKKIKDDNPKE
jgi:hypothetical protein